MLNHINLDGVADSSVHIALDGLVHLSGVVSPNCEIGAIILETLGWQLAQIDSFGFLLSFQKLSHLYGYFLSFRFGHGPRFIVSLCCNIDFLIDHLHCLHRYLLVLLLGVLVVLGDVRH